MHDRPWHVMLKILPIMLLSSATTFFNIYLWWRKRPPFSVFICGAGFFCHHKCKWKKAVWLRKTNHFITALTGLSMHCNRLW